MAITPLAIWCHRLPVKDIIVAVKEFTILIHPNLLVVFCNIFYVLMIVYFINRKCQDLREEDKMEAYNFAKTSIFTHIKSLTSITA